MIRNLIYHGLWNFYDHVGTLLLIGFLHAISALGLFVVGASVVAQFGHMLLFGALFAFLQLALLVMTLSAILPYCSIAANDKPARWPDLARGLKHKWGILGRILLTMTLILTLLGVNFFVYIDMQRTFDSQTGNTGLLIVDAIIGWTIVGLCVFLPPWLCAATVSETKSRMSGSFRAAVMALALLPGTWVCIFLLSVALIIFGVYTVVGLVLVLPVLTIFSHTAYRLSARYATFLAEAKAELGEDHSLKDYKKRAMTMVEEWEAKQPERSLKELIKPWEY